MEEIVRVKVHHFKVWNSNKNDWEYPPSKRTAESLDELQGEIIPDTAEEIDSTRLDDQGRYFPSGSVLTFPKGKHGRPHDPRTIEKENLDQVLEQTFPASDPVAFGHVSHIGHPKRK